MPYIKPEDRIIIDEHIGRAVALIKESKPFTAGEFNYMITKLTDAFVNRTKKNYANLNDAIGVLECAKLEYYRRIASPYEEGKILENGDVYGH